jgi:hypothetical protein
MILRIFLIFLALVLLIQLFRPEKNIHPGPQPNSIANFGVPQNVHSILSKACYDCHSNNTRYPWYNNVQPIAWFLSDHVAEGKRELNFDEFAAYSLKRKKKKLEETVEMVKEDKMPLRSYLWIHKDAKLTAAEKATLTNWAQSLSDQLR